MAATVHCRVLRPLKDLLANASPSATQHGCNWWEELRSYESSIPELAHFRCRALQSLGNRNYAAARDALVAAVLVQPAAWLAFEFAVRLNSVVGGRSIARHVYSANRIVSRAAATADKDEQQLSLICRTLELCGITLEQAAAGKLSLRQIESFRRQIRGRDVASLPVLHTLAVVSADLPQVSLQIISTAQKQWGSLKRLPLPLLVALLPLIPEHARATIVAELEIMGPPNGQLQLCPERCILLACGAPADSQLRTFCLEALRREVRHGRDDLARLALRTLTLSREWQSRLCESPRPTRPLRRLRAALTEFERVTDNALLPLKDSAAAAFHANGALFRGLLVCRGNQDNSRGGDHGNSNCYCPNENELPSLASQRRAMQGSRFFAWAARLSDDAIALYAWALSLQRRDRPTEAEHLVSRAISKQPLQLEFRWLRALARARLGNTASSASDLWMVTALLRRAAADAAAAADTTFESLLPVTLALKQRLLFVESLSVRDLVTSAPQTGGDGAIGSASSYSCVDAPLMKQCRKDPWSALLHGEQPSLLRFSDTQNHNSPTLNNLLAGHARRFLQTQQVLSSLEVSGGGTPLVSGSAEPPYNADASSATATTAAAALIDQRTPTPQQQIPSWMDPDDATTDM